jgi:gas vesicle protein
MKEEKIMNKDHAVGFGVGLLSGVVIGGIIALLFAPQSGKETRKMIKDKASGMMDAIKGKAAEANELVDTVKEKTSGVVHALKS